jgi:hypothetical protein
MPPWRLEPDGRTLRIDLVTWLEGSEWERLFDGITQEISSVDRVTFVVPQEGPATAQLLLESFVQALQGRGLTVEVQRRSG